MQNLGLLAVDLYCRGQYIFTIEQTDPDAEMLMFCPPSPDDFQWPQNCDGYTLLFNGDNPSENSTIYTHDFHISGTSRAARFDIKNHTVDENPILRTALGRLLLERRRHGKMVSLGLLRTTRHLEIFCEEFPMHPLSFI
ncbi:hypothetical protein LENED_010442 [Lentinula edodes]|uniref:Uncharacterized protein n=1 Tax=Lentinula edodes TaxID=5353 RepID=A0A1Q3EMP7_LENED|nr:hypothetical protein LENED_010442 [Lentinula edodes]